MPCGLFAPKRWTVRRTILLTHQNQLPLWTNFNLYGGLSAIHLRQPTRDNNISGLIPIPTYGLSGPPFGGLSATQSCEPHQRHRLWTNFKFQRRTVRSPIADCPQSILLNHQRQHHLWTKPNLTGGLSVPPRRTVRDT